MDHLLKLTKNAKHIRVTTPAGTDVEFDNNPEYPVTLEYGRYDVPGSHMTPVLVYYENQWCFT